MNWIRRIGFVLLIALVIIQFFQPEKPEVITENPNDIHEVLTIKPEVSQILKTACYDCHSNETNYPWYANVAPISWLVIHDVEEGRHELNFSEWATYSEKKKHHKLEEAMEEVEEGEMPLQVYTLTHGDASLSDTQVAELVSWVKAEMGKISVD